MFVAEQPAAATDRIGAACVFAPASRITAAVPRSTLVEEVVAIQFPPLGLPLARLLDVRVVPSLSAGTDALGGFDVLQLSFVASTICVSGGTASATAFLWTGHSGTAIHSPLSLSRLPRDVGVSQTKQGQVSIPDPHAPAVPVAAGESRHPAMTGR